MSEGIKLNRSVSLPLLIFYGVGTIVGGGFYALVGKVSGEAGLYAPIALAIAGTFALLTGLSFSELVSRFPVSAGEVRYVSEGFKRNWIAQLTGTLVILTGIVSAAALAVATVGFLQDFINVPAAPAICLLVIAMGAVAAWGIGQSVFLVAVITVIEVGALIYVVAVAEGELSELTTTWRTFLPSLDGDVWVGIFSAAFLAFYAFIGFEDLVNIAEEAKAPRRNMPIAIIVSVILSTSIYVLVSLAALLSVPPEQLAASNTPVAEIVRGHS